MVLKDSLSKVSNITMKDVRRFLKKQSLVIGFLIICISLTILTDRFLTLGNILNVIRQVSISGLLSLGLTFVILSGGIDLSVASVMAFAGCMAAEAQKTSLFTGIAVPILIGAIFGLLNGLMVNKIKAQPFIMTLGLGTTVRGLTYVYTNGEAIYSMSPVFRVIGGGRIADTIPVPAVIFVVIILISFVILNKTLIGRYIYAVGDNVEAARLSGIKVEKINIFVYLVSGILAGIAAVVLTSRLNAAEPIAGIGWELDAVAAVIIGGTSLRGGKGGVWGTVLGLLIIGVVSNGLNLLNVSTYYQSFVKGLIILFAVIADKIREYERD